MRGVFYVCGSLLVFAYAGYLIWTQVRNRKFRLSLTLEALCYLLGFSLIIVLRLVA